MLLQIGSYILLLGIAFYQVTQGLFSALIMAICTIFSALVALNFYEPMADSFAVHTPAIAEPASLLALFALCLWVLRLGFDLLLRNNVVFGMWGDRIGGGALGLVSGLVIVGMLMLALQMMPWGLSVLGFAPYDRQMQRQSSSLPADFTLGLFEMVSDGSLAAGKPFEQVHPNLTLELAAARNQVDPHSRTSAPEDAFEVRQAFVFDRFPGSWLPDGSDLPPGPTMESTTGARRILVVQVEVTEQAREEIDDAKNWYRLPATHFQLTTADGKHHYPVAYLTYHQTQSRPGDYNDYKRWREQVAKGPGQWKAVLPPTQEKDDERPSYADLRVERRWWSDGGPDKLPIYWVYVLPAEAKLEEAFLTFRRVVSRPIPKLLTGEPHSLDTKDALARIVED